MSKLNLVLGFVFLMGCGSSNQPEDTQDPSLGLQKADQPESTVVNTEADQGKTTALCTTKIDKGYGITAYYSFEAKILSGKHFEFKKFLSDPVLKITLVNDNEYTVTNLGVIQLRRSGNGASYIAFVPSDPSYEESLTGVNYYPSWVSDDTLEFHPGSIMVFDDEVSGASKCKYESNL